MSDMENTLDDSSPEHIKKLRADAAAARDLEKALAAKEREIAFLQAGVKTDSKLGAMLMKTYDGELSAEAIRAEAVEIGLVGDMGEPVVAETQVGEAEMKYQQARESFSAGDTALPSDPPAKSAVDVAFDEWNDARRGGMSNADAQDLAFASFISAAANGDSTATFDERQWQQNSRMY
jgi:hypothetical protein